MLEYVYEAVIHIQLRQKNGTMNFKINENQVEGFLDILENQKNFYGKIDKNGNCIFYSRIGTLITENQFSTIHTRSFVSFKWHSIHEAI